MKINPFQKIVQSMKKQLELPDSVAQEGSRFRQSRTRFEGNLSQVDGLHTTAKKNRTKKPHQK